MYRLSSATAKKKISLAPQIQVYIYFKKICRFMTWISCSPLNIERLKILLFWIGGRIFVHEILSNRPGMVHTKCTLLFLPLSLVVGSWWRYELHTSCSDQGRLHRIRAGNSIVYYVNKGEWRFVNEWSSAMIWMVIIKVRGEDPVGVSPSGEKSFGFPMYLK